MFNCKFCKKEFKIKCNLEKHKQTTKYCLKIQNEIKTKEKSKSVQGIKDDEGINDDDEGILKNKNKIKNNLICKYCKIKFSRNDSLAKHIKICSIKITNNLEKQIEEKNKQFEEKEIQYKQQIEKLEEKQVQTISNNNEQLQIIEQKIICKNCNSKFNGKFSIYNFEKHLQKCLGKNIGRKRNSI